MNEKTYKASFIKALGGLALTLGEAVPGERFLAYFEIFKNHDPELVLTAIGQAGLTCKFFPKPAELIELMTGGKGGGKDPAVAWQEVLYALESRGVYADVEFRDGAIAVAIELLGGWPALGEMTYDEMTYQRIPARFEALYKDAVRNGAHRRPRAVYGRVSIDNSFRGLNHQGQLLAAESAKDVAIGRSPVAFEALPAPPKTALKTIPAEYADDLGRLAGKKAI